MTLPTRSPRRPSRTRRRILAVTSLGLAGLLAGLLSGCGTGSLSSAAAAAAAQPNSYAAASGNWQFSSTSSAALRLSSLGGSLAVNGTSVSGMLHPLVATSQCLATSTALAVAGAIDSAGHLTLSGPLAGGTLNLSGTLAPDRRTLTEAAYTVTGGACAFPSIRTSAAQAVTPRDETPPVTAQQYTPVSGTYTGTLTTTEGETFALSTSLTQTDTADSTGTYHLTGTAASPGNTCVPLTLPATASTVNGGSISTTYTDAASGTVITGTGTSSIDGTTITITAWTITSPCGTDTGSGTLTQL